MKRKRARFDAADTQARPRRIDVSRRGRSMRRARPAHFAGLPLCNCRLKVLERPTVANGRRSPTADGRQRPTVANLADVFEPSEFRG